MARVAAARKTAAPKTPARKPAAKKVAARKVVVRKPAKPVTKMESESASLNLVAYIPSMEIALKYVGRQIHGVWDLDLAENAAAHDRNMLLMGDTGSGKTLFGEAFAAKTKRIYYSVPCDVSIDPSSFFGKMQPTDTVGKFVWQDGPVTQVIRGQCGLGGNCMDEECIGGVLNISEVNFMQPKISASLYPLMDNRRYLPLLGHRGEVVRCHHNTLIIADMNPQYRGTLELNAAFKNRFAHKVPWGYNDDVEERLVKFDTLRKLAREIRDMVGTDIMTPVSTNMLMEFEMFALDSDLGLDYAIGNFAAAFDSDEVAAIDRVLDLNKSKLAEDVAFSVTNSASDEDDEALEDIDVEFEEED